MTLIHLQTLKYPVSIYEVRAASPNTSFPSSPDYVPDGYAAVQPTPFPTYDQNTQKYVELPPIQDGEVWRQVWQVVELDPEEQQKIRDARSSEVRKKREVLLAQSDWTQLSDAPVNDKAAWLAYRQALRDVPSQAGFPFSIDWPERP